MNANVEGISVFAASLALLGAVLLLRWLGRLPSRSTFAPLSPTRVHDLEGRRLASFQRRALAWLIDFTAVSFLAIALELAWSVRQNPGSSVTFQFKPAHSVLDAVLLVAYFGLSTYLGNGQTLGKRSMKIRVVSLTHNHLSLWHSIERALGYAASALEAGFGFWQYFVHPNRQTVHDRIAETVVLDLRPSLPGKAQS